MRPAVLLECLEPRTLMSRAVGVDVSSAQGQPTWSSAFSAGVQFAYAKATEGTGYTNPDFTYDMSNGTAANVVMGAYDYARYDAVSAAAEANYFLSVAGPYLGAGYLRPMLDVEQASSLTKSQISTWVDTWCGTVYQATGVKPIIYCSSGNASNFFDSTVTQWYNWMASWPSNPQPQTGAPSGTAPWSGWNIWQYADNGNISGIGTVDMDVANGDMTTYVIPQLVGGSTQFSTGEVVYVNAPSGLKAYSTYTSNGSYTTEPNGTSGVIQGNPVYINGYLRWPIKYSGSTSVTWSAGAYVAADIPSVSSFSGSPNPATAGNNVTLTANVADPDSTVSSVLFYRESDGTAGLQSGRGGDALLGYGTSNGSGGWTISTATSGLSGSVTYYAVATNAGGATSAAASTGVTINPAPPAWLAAGSQATWNASTHTLTVTGAAVIAADPGADEPNIVEGGSAARLVIQPATSPTDVHVGGISLSNGAALQVAGVGAGRTHANHNVLVVGTTGAAGDPTFSIDSTSNLDLSDNDLVLHVGASDALGAAAYNTIFAQARSGRHGDPATPDGTWDGFGLDSSAATAVFNAQGYEQVALAVADNNQLVFGALSKWTVGSASESLGANDVIVKYTYVGDYALEGMVGDDNAGILQVEYDKGASN
ncbi:MAG TPA: glycoside hydrolase family 25 protein, partial [Tepidisphaeraceae bacterium]